jgi:flagellar biosynthesis protein
MKKIRRSGNPLSVKVTDAEEPAKSSIAVAIEHRPTGPNSLPKIVASGRGNLADKIMDIAFAEGVRVREDADLAKMLAAADIDTEIPVEAFIAVAEILRYVYAANGTQMPEVDSS